MLLACILVLLAVWADRPRAAQLQRLRAPATATATAVRCSAQSGVNLTSEDIAPPKYLFSQGDCCDYCAHTADCVAANYVDYLCSPKGSLEQVASAASLIVITNSQTGTPAPTAQPTSSTAQPAGSSPTTAQPASSSAPTTQAPPNSDTSVLLLTTCTDSSSCSHYRNSICSTQLLNFSVCYDNFIMYSLDSQGSHVVRLTFSTRDCEGSSPVSKSFELNECESYDSGYRKFAVAPPPEPSPQCSTLIRQSCTGPLNTPGCEFDVFSNGGCELTGDYHSSGGQSTIVVTGTDFVWWRTYSTTDCTGPPTMSYVDPINEPYAEGSTGTTSIWTCGAVTPASPAPLGSVLLAVTTVCQGSANCSVVDDATCHSAADPSGSCVAFLDLSGDQRYRIRSCESGWMETFVFDDPNCTGSSHKTLKELNNCSSTDDDTYQEASCVEIPSQGGLFATYKQCTSGPPETCVFELYITGTCMSTSGGSNHQGSGIVVYCSQEYAWWRTYQNSDCSGAPLQSFVDRLNLRWTNGDVREEWVCGAPPPPQITPPDSVMLVLRVSCANSATCNVAQDDTCVTHAYPTKGRCYAGSSGGFEYLCYEGMVVRRMYPANDVCNGGPYYEQWMAPDACQYGSSSGEFEMERCAAVNPSQKGNTSVSIRRSSCNSGTCTNTTFTPGVCQSNTIVYCGDSFVWRQSFAGSDCTPSTLLSSLWDPVDVLIPSILHEGTTNEWKCFR